MEIKGLKINFLGDSITYGAGASTLDNNYVNLIAREGAICQNYGIGGTRIAIQKDKKEDHDYNDFNSRLDKMDTQADVVFVFGGTNDYGHGDAPIGDFADRTPDTFYGALHSLYTGLLTKYVNSKIVIITPLHRRDEQVVRTDAYGREYTHTLKPFVDAIREVAEYYSLPVLDLYANSGINPVVDAVNQKYFADGLHPNDNGYRVIADKIISFIKNM
ncbi:MAG: SGNH/GDSL hydrolase family protein [Clostridia bacterium]|nr:SGNH/GDSL hydrolase family protein [Clostridia bacterium]